MRWSVSKSSLKSCPNKSKSSLKTIKTSLSQIFYRIKQVCISSQANQDNTKSSLKSSQNKSKLRLKTSFSDLVPDSDYRIWAWLKANLTDEGLWEQKWASDTTIDHFIRCGASQWTTTDTASATHYYIPTDTLACPIWFLFSLPLQIPWHVPNIDQWERRTLLSCTHGKANRNDVVGAARWNCVTASQRHPHLFRRHYLFTFLFPEVGL